jgi:hypothetical protein
MNKFSQRISSQSCEGLRRSLQIWKDFGAARHLLAIGIIGAVAILRWWHHIFLQSPLTDEMVYLSAFQSVLGGESPFTEVAYLYPSATAFAGAWALRHFDQSFILVTLRGVNVLGLAATVWLSLAWLRGSWRRRLVVGSLFVALAPAVGYGISSGNLSLAISGMVLYGLMYWRRWPVLCGLVLGLSVVIKPMAPVAILVLLLHRSERAGRSHLWAAAVACAVSGSLILGLPHLEEMLNVNLAIRASRSISIFRLIHLAGWNISPFFLTAIVGVVACFLARRHTMDQLDLLILSITATLAATALVRPHTLLLSLPVQAAALDIGLSRFKEGRIKKNLGTTSNRRANYEVIFLILTIAAIQFAEGATAIDDQAVWFQWVGTLLPALAPIVLAGYVLKMRSALSGSITAGSQPADP